MKKVKKKIYEYIIMNSKRRSGFQNDTRAYFGLRGLIIHNPSQYQVRANTFYLRYY